MKNYINKELKKVSEADLKAALKQVSYKNKAIRNEIYRDTALAIRGGLMA